MNDNDYLIAYKQYLGLKLHFADKSVKYTGINAPRLKRVTVDTLLKRKDLPMFVRLAEKVKDVEEREKYLISVFVHDRHAWIGDITSSSYDIIHSSRIGRISDLEYNVKTELEQILMTCDETLQELLIMDGDRPRLLKVAKKVSDETLVALSKHSDILSFDSYNPVWNNRRITLQRYADFINVDCLSSFIKDKINIEEIV